MLTTQWSSREIFISPFHWCGNRGLQRWIYMMFGDLQPLCEAPCPPGHLSADSDSNPLLLSASSLFSHHPHSSPWADLLDLTVTAALQRTRENNILGHCQELAWDTDGHWAQLGKEREEGARAPSLRSREPSWKPLCLQTSVPLTAKYFHPPCHVTELRYGVIPRQFVNVHHKQ